MAEHPRLMPHIHLPLQSGSDRILERMGRGYTYKHYKAIIDFIRKKMDYISITTDLIVGFPGETVPEYEQTLKAVEEVQFDAAFMFRYSVRPDTRAAKYEDDVADQEKIHRLKHLIELQKEIGRDRNQREVGRIDRCMVEGFSRRSKMLYRARSQGNKTVLFSHDGELKPGEVIPIEIRTADAFTLHGEVVEVAQ